MSLIINSNSFTNIKNLIPFALKNKYIALSGLVTAAIVTIVLIAIKFFKPKKPSSPTHSSVSSSSVSSSGNTSPLASSISSTLSSTYNIQLAFRSANIEVNIPYSTTFQESIPLIEENLPVTCSGRKLAIIGAGTDEGDLYIESKNFSTRGSEKFTAIVSEAIRSGKQIYCSLRKSNSSNR